MGREWTDEQREEQRARMRDRQTTCVKCGFSGCRVVKGSELDTTCHFESVLYRVCSCCGHEEVVRQRKGRSRL